MTGRRLLLAAGVVLAVLGLAMTAAPGLAAAVPTRRRMVLLVGVVALLGAVGVLSRRRAVDVERIETGDPETLVDLPAPGDEARGAFRRASALQLTGSRDRVEQRLHEVATDVVARRHDCTDDAARALLASGEWTDDPFAAAFLSEDGATEAPRIPPTEWVRVDSPFQYRARRTVDAIIDLTEMEVER